MARRTYIDDQHIPKISMGREELIAALEARRPWAQAIDKKAIAEHTVKEKECLAAWKEKVKEAAKWTYAELKANRFEVEVGYNARPNCPQSIEAKLDQVLTPLKISTQKSYVLTPDRSNSSAHWLLTHDENAKSEVC